MQLFTKKPWIKKTKLVWITMGGSKIYEVPIYLTLLYSSFVSWLICELAVLMQGLNKTQKHLLIYFKIYIYMLIYLVPFVISHRSLSEKS